MVGTRKDRKPRSAYAKPTGGVSELINGLARGSKVGEEEKEDCKTTSRAVIDHCKSVWVYVVVIKPSPPAVIPE